MRYFPLILTGFDMTCPLARLLPKGETVAWDFLRLPDLRPTALRRPAGGGAGSNALASNRESASDSPVGRLRPRRKSGCSRLHPLESDSVKKRCQSAGSVLDRCQSAGSVQYCAKTALYKSGWRAKIQLSGTQILHMNGRLPFSDGHLIRISPA